MNGLELSKKYFEEYGRKMLEENFSEYLDHLTIGLVGHGSECFGFDDEVSHDHDFEPGFCIWLDDELNKEIGFKLFRAYSKLPKEYNGIKIENKSVLGSNFKGVHTIKEFYSFYLPNGEIPTTNEEWLAIPDFYLREATNGEIFLNGKNDFSKIREEIKNNYPDDVRLKKLASTIFKMAQNGQYNYSRALKHNEKGAAAILLSEFAKSTAEAIYILNKEFRPYDKWLLKGLEKLEKLSEIKTDLENLLEDPYNESKNSVLIEKIAKRIADKLREEGLSDRTEAYLEGYAYCVLNKIKDPNLRNSSVIE